MIHKKINLTSFKKDAAFYRSLIGCGLMLFALAACNQGNHTSKEATTSVLKDSTFVTTQIPKTSKLPEDTSLMFLKADTGQYPSDVKLLDQPVLKQRLEKLLGNQYAQFRKYWQTQTPIEFESNILSTTGCEVHNCAANQYILQIDLAHNNINVYHLGENTQSFLEKGAIQLPPGLAKEFNIHQNMVKKNK